MKFENNGHKLILNDGEIIGTFIVNVSDSFVRDNKLETSVGSGEARLYIGTREKTEPFFGESFINNTMSYRAVIHKLDLKYYLLSASVEYSEPENFYRKQEDMMDRYHEYLKTLDFFDEEIYFWVKLHNGIDDTRQNRIYIDGVIDDTVESFTNSNRAIIYNYFRKILLPIISKIQIVKIKNVISSNDETILWFRPYIHETSRLNPPANIREEEKKIQEDNNLSANQKYNLISSRIGQGKFRSDILERYQNSCAISSSDQIEILDACHILSWVKSNNLQKLEKKNGILLTKNLHKLFDLGFITFDINYDVIFSSRVTEKTKEDCKPISDKIKKILKESEQYLEMHRKTVFIEEL